MSYIVSTKSSNAGNGRNGSNDLARQYKNYFIFVFDGDVYRLYDDIAMRFCDLVHIDAYENGGRQIAVKIDERELKYYTRLLESYEKNYIIKKNKELAIHEYQEDDAEELEYYYISKPAGDIITYPKSTKKSRETPLSSIRVLIKDGDVVALKSLESLETEKVLLAKNGINIECEINRINSGQEKIRQPITISDGVKIVSEQAEFYKNLIGKKKGDIICVGGEQWIIFDISH